jgi:hypothetical protein
MVERNCVRMATAHPLLDAHRPVAGMVALLNRQAPCQQPACFASLKVGRFVIADHPAARSGHKVF